MPFKCSEMSVVFFDLETSGLPSRTNPARITELSMMAVSIRSVKNLLVDGGSNTTTTTRRRTPRIISKLTLAVNPQKELPPLVTRLTGLGNSALSEHPPFSSTTASLLSNFLSCLPQPVHLVAHNGVRFDLPLLRAELLYSQPNCLQHIHVLVADSLLYFTDKWKRSKTAGERPRPSFTLGNLYRRYFGLEPPGAHSSESDTMAVMQLCLAEGDHFLSWLRDNSRTFDSITPMWSKPYVS